MSVGKVEIITGVERRRRWRLEEKLRIVAEAAEPGARVSEVARRNEVSRGLLTAWRRQVRDGVLAPERTPRFIPVRLAAEGTPPAPRAGSEVAPGAGGDRRRGGLMEIELGGGRRITVDRHVDADALRRVLEALTRR